MEKENSKKQSASESLDLDPSSDRYRICPHPNCRKPHMARNRGKDYCCRQHADDHYNMIRRLKRQAEIDQAARLLVDHGSEEGVGHAFAALEQEKPAINNGAPLPENESKPLEEQSPLQRNIDLLNSIQLDPVHGSVFRISELITFGLRFEHNSGVESNHNIPPGLHSNFVRFGDYRIYHVDQESMLLIKKT